MCLGIPGKVVELEQDAELLMGKVDFGGISRRVCMAYVPDVCVDDYVVVHVGFALSKIDESEARRIYDLLRTLDELDGFEEDEPLTEEIVR